MLRIIHRTDFLARISRAIKLLFTFLLLATFLVTPDVSSQVVKKKPESRSFPIIEGSPVVLPQLPARQGVVPKRVMFADCLTRGSHSGMWVVDSTGDSLQHVSSREGTASWASDELRAVVVDPLNRLKILRIDKPGESVLITLPEGLTPKRPAWSPTADIIAFHALDENRVRQVYVVNADSAGSGFRQLTTDTMPSLFPAWHPDGSRLLVTSTPDNMSLGLYHVPLAGGALEPFFPPDSLQLASGVYSPDGKYVVAVARSSGNLVRVDSDGSNPFDVTRVGLRAYPFANPKFGKSSDYFICTGRKEGMKSHEIFQFALDGSYFKILTDRNDDLSWNYAAPNR